MLHRIRISHIVVLSLAGIIAIAAATIAQTPAATGPVMRFTATTVNVGGAPDSIRFDVLSWSSDADRDQLVGAWNLTAPPAAAGRGAAGGAEAGGRGGRGGDAAAAGGRGGRGGRGGAAGGAADAAPRTPAGALAAALQTGRTVGYLWSSESAGYSLRYAYRMPQPGGGERIIFATERRLGAWNDLWKPSGGAKATDYEFSVIELRLNAKGEGDGKASLASTVAVDTTANTIALENYTASPVVFKDVKRRAN